MPEPGSVPVTSKYKYKLLQYLGPDAPVLMLIWLLYMVSLWPLALMNQWKLCIISSPMSIGLGITFVVFSVGRGTSWLVMSYLALAASLVGTVQGIYLRVALPVLEEELPLGYKPALLRAVFIPAAVLHVVLLVSAPVIRRYGCRIVGTSEEYKKKTASSMIFGTALTNNLDQLVGGGRSFLGLDDHHEDEEDWQEAVLLRLLDDVYWSGEPIYDYAFWLANNHLFLGIVLHHPLSPLDTGHRFVILFMTCLLIVFPVALVTVLWNTWIPADVPGQGIVRLLFMAIVVILPRNMLKAKLRRISVQDQEQYINVATSGIQRSHSQHIKTSLTRKEARLYGAFVFSTLAFCVLTWVQVKEDIDKQPWILVLENTDGIGFCFVLEILFALIIPRQTKNNKKRCFGWWGRWHSERMWSLSS